MIDGRLTACDCLRPEIVRRRHEVAGYPPYANRMRLDTFTPQTDCQRDAHQRAQRFVDEFAPHTRGLLFAGRIGAGKTHLALAALWALVERGYMGRFVDVPRLVSLDFLAAQTYIHYASHRDIVLLDDVGQERTSASEYPQAIAIELIRALHAREVTVLATSNCTPEEFRRRYHEAAWSRLRERCEFVPMDGPDGRLEP